MKTWGAGRYGVLPVQACVPLIAHDDDSPVTLHALCM